MARRGLGGGMTALRAALGAVSGGLEGARIQEAAAAEKKRMADAASRQSMLDEIALVNQGFVEKGVREGLVRQATPAIGNAIRTAQAAMSGNITDAQPVDFSSLGKAAGMYGDTPAASVTLGGKTFQRMQTPIQASLMAAEQAAQLASQGEVEKRRTLKAEQDTARLRATDLTARARKGDPDAKNELLATNPSVYKELFPTRTPREANVKFDDKTGMMINLDTGKATKVQGYTPVEDKVHIPGTARTKMSEYESSIALLESAQKIAGENQGAFGFKTILPSAIVGRTGGENQKAYNKARADVERAIMKIRRTNFGTAVSKSEKEGSISLFPAKGDSYEQLAEKLSSLLEMARTEQKSLMDEYGVSPKSTEKEAAPPAAKPATDDPDFTAAKAAIAAGKDRNAVIQRYESSGKKWPGGA